MQKRFEKRFKNSSFRKRAIRYSLFGFNLLLLIIVIAVTVQHPQTSDSLGSPQVITSSLSQTDPLDQVSSADIALTVSRVTNMPESTAVKNQDESVQADLAQVPTNSSITSEPLIVATAFKSNEDIKNYVTQPGDTIASVAAKFGITSQSLEWSNRNVSTIAAGITLTIPPINGIVYTVQSGDTPQSLATKYNSNLTQLVAYNDAEIAGLHTGEKIIIPNGQEPSVATYNFYFTPQYVTGGYNGYDFGYCTWYVATQIPVPSNWGNASSWAYYASLSGWQVSSAPSVGAIAQTPYAAGGEGHVAIVTAVSADGSSIQFKDMNGVAGWDRVGYSGWVPASTYLHYISH